MEEIEWGRGQPNNYNQEQNCAVLDSELDWEWNDISCKISAMAVCEGAPSRCASPRVEEGTYTTGGNGVGEEVTYHCPLGDMPVGQSVAVPFGFASGFGAFAMTVRPPPTTAPATTACFAASEIPST